MKCPFCDGRRTMFTREQPGVGTQFGEIKLVVCPKCKGIGEVEEKKQTNFQRITASPEELADLMQDCVNCDDCPITDKIVCEYKYESCREAWLEWLKQESKNENMS